MSRDHKSEEEKTGKVEARMSSTRQRRKHTEEFKREAVDLVLQGKDSVAEVASRLGISANILYRWKQELATLGENAFPGHGQQTGLEAELRRLRAENERLRMEREILKKAAAFFAKESK